MQWGAEPNNVIGMDVLPGRLGDAKRLCAPGVRLYCGDGGTLALRGGWFDLVLQVTMFTSILDADLRRRVASEMLRVIKPQGLILWYDFHVQSPRNASVRAVRKQEIHNLFPDCAITLRRVTLAPPLARLLAPRSLLLCQLLERIPPLRTHYLGIIRKSQGGAGLSR